MSKLIASFVKVDCECGAHIVNLKDKEWEGNGVTFYHCNDCNRPLVCRGPNGKMYYIGGEV